MIRVELEPRLSKALKLYIGSQLSGVTVEPDAKYPTMWRIHMGQRVSDMVNLSRAKDAAVAWARPKGLGNYIAHWHLDETGSEAC